MTNYKVSKIWFLTQTGHRTSQPLSHPSFPPAPRHHTHTPALQRARELTKGLELFSTIRQRAAPHEVADQLPYTQVSLDVQTQINSFHNRR